MHLPLQDKVAVVTGGNSGIGLATAKRFVSEGAFVFITGRRQSELDAAVASIGKNVAALQADSSKLEDLDAVFKTVKESKGRVDILFANAGIFEKAPIDTLTEAHFDRLFDINVKGLLFTVQKALPLMPDGSAIVLTSSTVANMGLGDTSAYSATKAAVRNFARGWTVDLKARRIRVNAISPGLIDTPGLMGSMPGDAAAAQAITAAMAQQVPAGRFGLPDEIAKVAVFLASDAASYVNGADIQVDGGWAQV